MPAEPAVAECPEDAGPPEDRDATPLPPCFDRLPRQVRDGFTAAQRQALNDWAVTQDWTRHPVDIRLSIPTLLSRYYLVVLGGRERRHKARRAAERQKHPLSTCANWLFIAGTIGMAFYFFALLAASLFTWYHLG